MRGGIICVYWIIDLCRGDGRFRSRPGFALACKFTDHNVLQWGEARGRDSALEAKQLSRLMTSVVLGGHFEE